MRIRLTSIPRDPQAMTDLAVAVEDAGLDGLGIADSPHLHGATYPVVQHLLGATRRITIGPFVTNPLTRHPSVQAADLDALSSLHPGRVGYGIGTGDSAVSSIGLRPATARRVAECIDVVHARVGDRVPALFAAGGPVAAGSVPATAAGVVLGGGLDLTWSGFLADRAEAAAGHRLQRWGFLVSSLGPADEAPAREREVLGSVTTVARHALAGDMAAKGVPAELVPGLREVFDAYDVREHGRLDSAHHRRLDGMPEHRQYLLDRFAVVDAGDRTVERLREHARLLGLDGIYLSATVPDQVRHARHVAADLAPALA